MNDTVKLGQLLDPKADVERDAIHVAVFPVTAAEVLKPGSRGVFTPKGDRVVLASRNAAATVAGVVDPFLQRPVKEGERFLLMVMPGTITALRHAWTHPAFPLEASQQLKADQMRAELENEHSRFFETFARKIDQPVETLMGAARDYVASNGEEYFHAGDNESYGNPTTAEWREFWERFNKVENLQATDMQAVPFSCAC